MATAMSDREAMDRRATVLSAARWCFLNFGFQKTSFEDIAKRAHLSRTLLYRLFSDKKAIYRAVFIDWLVSRHGAAKAVAKREGSAAERLLEFCRLMVAEPWAEMVGAPMGAEFLATCERVDPKTGELHLEVLRRGATALLGDAASAEVFLLALDGLLADQPSAAVLEKRIALLVARFAPRGKRP
ncbi:MAG: helix-turn-helix domain-containing protein [Myxococcaceae bacterium]